MRSTADGGSSYRVSGRYSWYVFSLLFLLYMFDWIDRLVVVSLFPFLKRDWGISDTECGMLVSAVYWSILLFSFPASLLVDRWSRRKAIGLMALLWSLATAACAFTRSFGQLFAARTAIGIGEAGYAPGGTAMISALFPRKRRAAVMGLWNASIPLGSALGIVIGGVVAEYLGWRHAFGLVAFPGMIVALLFFRVRDYRTVSLRTETPGAEAAPVKPEPGAAREAVAAGEGSKAEPGFRGTARRLLGTPSLLLTYLGFSGNMFLTSALMTWLPTAYHRHDGLPMSQASLKGGAVMAMAIVGAPLGGWLADRWYSRRADARLLFAALSSLAAGLVLLVALGALDGPAQYGLLLAGGALASAFVPGAAAATQDVVHPGLRATAYSLCVIVMHVLGSALGPVFVGAASDRYSLQTGLTLVPFSALLAAVCFFAASRFYARDLARVEQVELVSEEAQAGQG